MTAAAPASTTAVANELVALCRAGRNLDAIAKLYSPKVVSIEPVGSETMPAEMTGIEAIRQKNEWWFDNYNVNAAGGKDVSEVSLIVEPRNLTFAKKPVSRVSQSFQCRP